MQPHKAAPSLFDLADPPAAAPSWASASSGVGTAPASRPSWAHVSGTFAPVDGVEGHEAEPLKRSEEHVLKSSVDFLRGRKHSGDWDLGVGPLSDASSDILSSEKEPSPDQIGSFMRYGDDDTRVQAMNRIVALLKAKVEARDATYLSHCVATVLRLAEASAFGRVRAAFREVLDTIKAAQLPGVVVPVLDTCTRWVSPHELPSIDASDANDSLVSRLLRSINVMEGRVPHIIMVLAWHPTFLERWYRSVMFLMRGPGPLPFLWRRFISIVACARFQCMPLLKLQEMDFLSSGGDPAWVREGLQCPDLPAKLHALMELNAMLAHQPWLITAQKMQALLGLSVSKEATWSIGELLHAISIMTMFHAMSGLVWGLGIRPELDLEQLHHTSLEGPQAHPFGTLSEDTIAPSEHVVADDASRLLDILKSGADSFTAQRQDWMESEADRKSYIWAEAEGERVLLLIFFCSAALSASFSLRAPDTQSIHDLNNMIRASSDRKSADLQYCSKYIGPWTMTHEVRACVLACWESSHRAHSFFFFFRTLTWPAIPSSTRLSIAGRTTAMRLSTKC